jgi:hypothetical protein
MSSALAFVEEAGRWARALVWDECRRPGDYADAMRRVSRRTRVPFGLLWNLHYRQPKTIGVEKYAALGAAYCDYQRRKYQEEREAAAPSTALGAALLRAADYLARQDDEGVTDGGEDRNIGA